MNEILQKKKKKPFQITSPCPKEGMILQLIADNNITLIFVYQNREWKKILGPRPHASSVAERTQCCLENACASLHVLNKCDVRDIVHTHTRWIISPKNVTSSFRFLYLRKSVVLYNSFSRCRQGCMRVCSVASCGTASVVQISYSSFLPFTSNPYWQPFAFGKWHLFSIFSHVTVHSLHAKNANGCIICVLFLSTKKGLPPIWEYKTDSRSNNGTWLVESGADACAAWACAFSNLRRQKVT